MDSITHAGPPCTCLSISRDPLCVVHGDVDKIQHMRGDMKIERAMVVEERKDTARSTVFELRHINEGTTPDDRMTLVIPIGHPPPGTDPVPTWRPGTSVTVTFEAAE